MMITVRPECEEPAQRVPGGLAYRAIAVDVSTGEPVPGMHGNGCSEDEARLKLDQALNRKYNEDWEWEGGAAGQRMPPRDGEADGA